MTTPYPSPPDARANRAAEARAHGGLLEPGRNCDALLHAERFATLIDGDAYFSTLRAALRRARHTVFIVGWDIDSRLRLVPDGAHDGWPEPLAAFLHALANARRRLRIYVLAWDFSMIYALEREWPPVYRTAWRSRHGIVFRLDGTHPRGASHHQKFVVIDDRVAFVGGFDLTRSRWDTPRHAPDEPRRVDPNGARYAPFHDVQAMFDGDAAAAIGALARERWARTCGKRVAIRAHRRRAADDDPWPPNAPVDVRDVTLAIALTTPRHRGGDEVGHIRALTADAIAAARRDLYIENQYFTAAVVREALTARLAADDPPDVVVVAPREQSGWLQEATMGVLRARLHRALVDADRHGRYRLLCPHVDGLGELCVNVHSKLMCVDDDYLVIGSANLNNRSMVLDTECNIVLAANGEPRVREAIARTRERLLAEHLGVSADAVAAARACTGRLNRAIDALRGAHPHRTLRPFTPSASADLDALVPVSAWLDPERPIDADRLMSEFVPREQSRSLTARFLALGAFVLFAAALAAAWRFTPLGQHLSVASLARAGARAAELPAAPVALVAGYVAAALLAVPVTLLITATGLVFGAWPGIAYAAAGTLLAAAATYGIGRWLGRDAVRRLAGRRANRLSEHIGRRGIVAMAVLRLLPIAPFTVVNLVAGASSIGFRDYLVGTALGMLPGIVLTVTFAHQLSAALVHPTPAAFAWLAAIGLAFVGVSALLLRALGRRR
ncbi:phospholipase D [Burkholderia pseudomallei]|uniref:VTT domain-containing protein n=2 Tax=Burkholderia pseudomallei TaxID=28450 RepID=A0A8A4DYP4_BURPE|nr:VTT domain-containing protein [Burkholderia pseudomallei]AGR67807.1 phospholipase D family protein [Burkholderia pseudomallei MSHR305]AHE35606.1 phospholipase D family protein [Burkholderia pseudomallei NAU20B-16]AHG36612.1 phospholipase D family protein [Burkholderia pseudomallei MSHR511]AHG69870.1 phospholipase D family protein [Burkholderia pseudomallei MSHR146]AHK67338.1 phospholipase D family protein [Burkholderia pseudomallei MSHR520]